MEKGWIKLCIIITIMPQTISEYIFWRNFMVCDGTKRVVIIKNISSNIVEEAILVLKDRKSDKDKNKNVIITSANSSKKVNNYLLREAEDIINNYIRERDLKGGFVNELNLRPLNPKRKFFTNVVINTVLVASIALLLFLVTKIL